jgi:phosphoadenosine phosphosulfate reductase
MNDEKTLIIPKQKAVSAEEVLRQAVEMFYPDLKLACSFSAEDIVVLDMLARIVEVPRVFMLDTGRLPQETYDLVDRVRTRYGIEIEVYFPDSEAVEGMMREHGANLFYKSVELRKLCCHVRKVAPLDRALADVKAWITGLRREQSPTRARIQPLETDDSHGGIMKISPLVDWAYDDVWRYIREHHLPYNGLYDRGYKSIGCAPCTRPVCPDEPERAGRWWWESPDTKECGLHVRRGKPTPNR